MLNNVVAFSWHSVPMLTKRGNLKIFPFEPVIQSLKSVELMFDSVKFQFPSSKDCSVTVFQRYLTDPV